MCDLVNSVVNGTRKNESPFCVCYSGAGDLAFADMVAFEVSLFAC